MKLKLTWIIFEDPHRCIGWGENCSLHVLNIRDVIFEKSQIAGGEKEQSKAGSLFMQRGRWCSIIGALWPLGRKRKERD